MDSTKEQKCEHVNDSNITFNLSGRQVFREQCSKCYEDPQSEGGLDVCLKCFSGNCQNEMLDHSNLHYLQKGHPLVLNIKEKLKEKEKETNSDNQGKITKLAIGKPGGMELESNEEWERWTTVHCKTCKVDIDYEQNSKLKDLVTSIVNSSSAENKANVVDWELEVLPCEHTLTLQQDVKTISSKLSAKCADCDISSALWLCLTCGNLSCGRKNYDGTGGNGHAIEHFNKTGHPLVVKTGTITPDGSASLYCYSCDNDVKDPELPTHLSNFGIDISSQVKTEKTMTELNLEFNLNFTLSKAYEEGKILTPIYGPGHTGLENLGNSCYINSVIQILFSLEPFQQIFYDNALEHLSTCYGDTMNCFQCQMSKIMYGMHSGNFSKKITKTVPVTEDNKEGIEEYQKGIKPSSFKLFFNKDHPEFSTARQQDAFEYLAYLLEKFERLQKTNNGPNPKKLFDFELENRLECSQCHSVKYKTQNTCFLTLNVPDWTTKKDENSQCSFSDVVAKFIGEEFVDLNCPQCKKSTTWTKTQRVKTFPNYLIVIFQRFVYDWVPIKLETKLDAPTKDLDLSLLASSHRKEGEHVIQEDEKEEVEEIEPQIDSSALNLLIQNGLPELAAKHALLNNGNNPDFAIGWYFENMDNPILTTPIAKIKKQKQTVEEKSVPEELVENLINIVGCARQQAVGALRKCDNNPDRAIDYIFSHPEENFDEPKQEQVGEQIESNVEIMQKNNSSHYDMYAFITHLGRNTSHGHYVCHIKKGDNWVYFNDSKVNISQEPPIHKAYIYVYKSK